MRSTSAGGRSRNEFSSTDLDELERQLTDWRRKQVGARARLPKELWDSAAVLARSLGVSQVSRRLCLDYYKLSRWLGQARNEAWPRQKFVELAQGDASAVAFGPEFRAEVGLPAGSKLTFHLGRDVRAVVALAEAFWRREQ